MSIWQKIGAIATITSVLAFQASTVSADTRHTTRNGMRIMADSSDPARFDVLQRAGRGGPDYWCAAGQFVISGLNLPGGTRIFLVQALGRGRLDRNSVGYSVNPDISVSGSGTNRVTMSTRNVGQNWSAEHARTQCPEGGQNR